jgi:hypothetical protein
MKKRAILYLLIFTILACIIAVAAFPIGSLAAEDREIRKNGEVLYVHHGNGGYSGNDRGMFAGIVTRGETVYAAFDVRGTNREWLYVPGRDMPVYYQRVQSRGE